MGGASSTGDERRAPLLPVKRFRVARLGFGDGALLDVPIATYGEFLRWANCTFRTVFYPPDYCVYVVRRFGEKSVPVAVDDAFDDPVAVFVQPVRRTGVFAAGFQLRLLD